MRAAVIAVDPLYAIAPLAHEQIHQCAGLEAVHIIRANVIIASVLAVLVLHGSNHQVGIQRLQHMLIRAGGERVAHHNILLLHRRADAVRDDAIVGEVAAADDIACARRRNRHASISKEAVLVAVRHQLRAGLGIGVRVEAVQLLVLAVAPRPLLVQVHLVGRHIQEGLDAMAVSHALQNIHRAHDVRFIGVSRIFVAVTNDGLRRQMQHNLRLCGVKRGLQRRIIADIADNRVHILRNISDFKQGRRRRGIQ